MKLLKPLLCALVLGSSLPALADIGRDEAATVAQRIAKGRVLGVERTDVSGKPTWRVKILTTQGEVRAIIVDAASGRVAG